MAQQSSDGGRSKLSEKGLLTPDNCVVALIDHQAPNAVRNKQFRPPGNHQQHRGNRKGRKSIRCACGFEHSRNEVLQRKYVAAVASRIPRAGTYRAFGYELAGTTRTSWQRSKKPAARKSC